MTNALWKARKAAGLTRKALAEKVGNHYQTVAYHERPEYDLPSDWRSKYAEALGIPEWQLLPDELAGNYEIALTRVPVLGWADAGRPMPTEPYLADDIEYVLVPDALPDDYCLVVSGRSMESVAPDGAQILCRPSETSLVDKAYYIVEIEGDRTFKQYRCTEGPMRFEPASSDRQTFKTIYPSADTRIIARVKKVIVDL